VKVVHDEEKIRIVDAKELTEVVARLCQEASFLLPEDVRRALQAAVDREESPLGKDVLLQILENARMAVDTQVPLCQDCGYTVVFLDIGQQVIIDGAGLEEAVAEGVRRGYQEGYLRKSIVNDPVFKRKNTGDNTPPVIHLRIVPGTQIHVWVVPKGGGSENMSTLGMLKPAQGVEGVRQFVVDAVSRAGANPCPPIIVGVGLGGTSEKAMYLAKRALLREIGSTNPQPELNELEIRLRDDINKLGIGPQGFGGRVTALAVHIESAPCHIASLPVAVNIQCHSARHKEAII